MPKIDGLFCIVTCWVIVKLVSVVHALTILTNKLCSL